MMTNLVNAKSNDEQKIFKNLINEEDYFLEQVRVATPQMPYSYVMPKVQRLHDIIAEIIKYYQRKNLRGDAQYLLIEQIKKLEAIYQEGVFNELQLLAVVFSEEVELSKMIFTYALNSADVPASNYEILGQLISIRVEQLNIAPMVLKMLVQLFLELDDYKNLVRVRKQKSERNFRTVQKIIGSLSLSSRSVRCYRFDFCLKGQASFNVFDVSQVKDSFLKLLRNVLRNEIQYIWFLEFSAYRGYSLHFVFFSAIDFDATNLILHVWHQVVDTQTSFAVAYHLIGIDQRLNHRREGLDPNRSNGLTASLAYMCFREMYYKAANFSGLNTFGKGNFSNRRLFITNLPNHLAMQSGCNMSYGSGAIPVDFSKGDFNYYNNQPFPASFNPSFSNNNMNASMWSQSPALDTSACTPVKQEFKVSLNNSIFDGYQLEWNPLKTTNAMLLLIGQSGSGKSNSLMLLASESCKFVPVWIFDPHNSMDDCGFERILFSSGTESKLGINPFTIYADSLERKGLHDYKTAAIDIIKRASVNLGRRQINILAEALDSLYSEDKFAAQTLDQLSTQPSPTVEELLKVLTDFSSQPVRKNQKEIIDGCFAIVKSTFSHPVFHRTENFDVKTSLQKNMYFDLGALADTERFIIMESLLRQVFTVLSASNQTEQQDDTPSWLPNKNKINLKLLIVIDEARLLTLIGGDKDDSSRIINVIVNEGRKFGIGLILASQRYDHFSKDIHMNVASKLVHKVGDLREARHMAAILNVDPQVLIKLPIGGAVFYDGVVETKVLRVRQYINRGIV